MSLVNHHYETSTALNKILIQVQFYQVDKDLSRRPNSISQIDTSLNQQYRKMTLCGWNEAVLLHRNRIQRCSDCRA